MPFEGQTIFYNPKVAAISLGFSVISNTLQIKIAKAIDPNRKGRPKAGDEIYDWKNNAYFSLSPEECVPISFLWDNILSGEYKDPKAQNPDYAHYYNVTHYRENQPSRFNIVRADNPRSKNDPLMTITLQPPGKGDRFSYMFRKAEMLIFREFIDFAYKRLPIESALINAQQKLRNKEKWDRDNKEKEERGSGNSSGGPSGGREYQRPPQPRNEDRGASTASRRPSPPPPPPRASTGSDPFAPAPDDDDIPF